MAFNPISGQHAIQEVVFGIVPAHPFTQPEIEIVAQAHSNWKDQLPKVSRGQFFDITIGPIGPMPGPSQAPSPVLDFERINPDGTLSWRLHVESRAIFVNCLSYEGWDNAWPKARNFLKLALQHATKQRKNGVKSTIFQVIDVFDWTGDKADYNAMQLFRQGSELVPDSMFRSGPLWHLHQGRFFESPSLPLSAYRVLERVNIDSAENEANQYSTRVDVFQDLQLGSPISTSDFMMTGLEAAFKYLHDKNKDVVRALLTEDMSKRIGLSK